MKGSEFVSDSFDLLHYQLLNRGGSYIDSPEWLKNKKATINSKNNHEKCFQYAITVALDFQNINNHPERVNNINPFIDQYHWKEIQFPSHKNDWKKFKKNSKSIALTVLYVPHNFKEIRHAYKSRHYLNREDQVILLMIPGGKK